MKLLLIDDHAIVRAGLKRLLSALPGIELREVANGREALAAFRDQQPDVVLLDINLPGIGGLELLRRLVLERADVRVLVFSMHSEVIYARQCLQAGDSLGALLFDAAGSAAAEEAADRLGALVVAELAGQEARDSLLPAARLSCRISPGYGRWHLPAQRPLFARLPHAELGVTLTPSLLMSPRKSVSFALWLGADRRPLAGLSGCARCELEECRYRRAG